MARAERERAGLDWLVAGARAAAPLPERTAWLERVVGWVRSRAADGDSGITPATRLRFLLQVLARHPERRAEVAELLRTTLHEMDAVGLLSETGLPRAHAFFHEFVDRLSTKILPSPPSPLDLAELFRRLFPYPEDAAWIAALPPAVRDELAALLMAPGARPEGNPWAGPRRDAADALVILASHVQAVGLSHRVRRRTAAERPLDLPFASLPVTVHEYVHSTAGTPEAEAARSALASDIARCTRALGDVRDHLEQYGVSLDLVYALERARLGLRRMAALVAFRGEPPPDPAAVAAFIAELVRANVAQTSVRALLAENSVLLARRIVESARRTGEHYITHDAAQYRVMLRSAAIGGALTGMTVLVKLMTSGHGLPPFIEGLVASLNYATSFVLIHLLHGTLATKQPAMTAATMADHLMAAGERRRVRAFVGEVASLVRSQVAAIAGNLLLVVPAALALQALLLGVGVGHVPAPEQALHYIEGLSVWGATPLYAAFTGVLLWLSALFAGAFENWAAYRRLPEAVAGSPLLARWLGKARQQRFAALVEDNVAALGGNVSLGFLLGMVPVVALFFGLPLEVRHVTLSTGQLALASWAHGGNVFALPAFWLAVAGIGVIGFLNLTVSFVLAMALAIRSTGRGAVSRGRLARAVLAHLVASPRDFLLPPRRTPSVAAPAAPGGGAATASRPDGGGGSRDTA